MRSSRQIERRCQENLAFRVLAGNRAPDHATIARFRVRHEAALAELLVASLRLCAAAGLVRLGVLALDGTKVAANAAERANRTLDKVEAEVAEILRQAAEADQRENLEHGHARGDELPAELASRTGRLARLRQAKARLEAEAAKRQCRYEQRVAELAAAARARGRQPRARSKPRRQDEAPNPKASANITDPDSRFLHTRNGAMQGYNAQAVVTEGQVVVEAELTQQVNDLQQLRPMLQAESDRGAGLRAAQGAAGRPPVPATRAGRLRGGVEAAVRHPQPAQAVAPRPPPSRNHSNHHLNGGQRRPCLPRRPPSATARRSRQARHRTRERASSLAAASPRGLSAKHC
jgi:hypothetical protein